MSRRVTVFKTLTTDATKTVLFTVPSKNNAVIKMIYILAVSGTDSPTLFAIDTAAASTEYRIAKGNSLDATSNDYLLLNEIKINLKPTDVLKVQNSAGTTTVTYVVSLELESTQLGQFN